VRARTGEGRISPISFDGGRGDMKREERKRGKWVIRKKRRRQKIKGTLKLEE
jgi:hypothetical protein